MDIIGNRQDPHEIEVIDLTPYELLQRLSKVMNSQYKYIRF